MPDRLGFRQPHPATVAEAPLCALELRVSWNHLLTILLSALRYYGWARLSVKALKRRFTLTATLTGFAYETIPGKPIIAGQTKGPDEDRNDLGPASLTAPTWKPATLGALALGAPGLTIWRRDEAGARCTRKAGDFTKPIVGDKSR